MPKLHFFHAFSKVSCGKYGDIFGITSEERVDIFFGYGTFINIEYRMHIHRSGPGVGCLQTLKVDFHNLMSTGSFWDPGIDFLATKIPPACPQLFDPINSFTEDCLYLNVFRPSAMPPKNLLPVMIWIYGGAFLIGNSWQFGLYDARNIVKHRRAIVVSFNYRLGSLGFLYTSGNSVSPNLGILDQIAAINWVKANIINFGGDPDNITLIGESAGAMSIGLLVSSKNADIKNLFQKAIIMSNPFAAHYKSLSEAAVFGDLLCKGNPSLNGYH
ncbi:para-nitrobenzyl esterase [Mitosporidium daphniae]|uniref:Carboxylic ester hydrolase n=1 Tax=Mitosporidium daphniae TaxID=1485682 RepID=A0A098VR28_9MICR|nr:para-nitrobenzyl esterase [Mitosporidium daphniae]KGG51365.1 para-nitrobenzyl esterase [Mitosporidium daphniae]|eukprot:XP_013237813.1 para-nitrobenzyl esterase [Mitosporidium daphniae]